VPEPGSPHTDAEIATELEAIRARVAALPEKGREVAAELLAIREQLRRLAVENEAVRRTLRGSLGLSVDEGPIDDA
jgi:hypothetical protein